MAGNDEKELADYFTPEELAEMGPYEKTRHWQILNFNFVQELGK